MKKPFRALVVATLVLFVVAVFVWLTCVLAIVLQLDPRIVGVPIAILVSWLGARPLVRMFGWTVGMSRTEIQQAIDRASGHRDR